MATAVDVARELTLRQTNYYHATRTATSGGNPHLSASAVGSRIDGYEQWPGRIVVAEPGSHPL